MSNVIDTERPVGDELTDEAIVRRCTEIGRQYIKELRRFQRVIVDMPSGRPIHIQAFGAGYVAMYGLRVLDLPLLDDEPMEEWQARTEKGAQL